MAYKEIEVFKEDLDPKNKKYAVDWPTDFDKGYCYNDDIFLLGCWTSEEENSVCILTSNGGYFRYAKNDATKCYAAFNQMKNFINSIPPDVRLWSMIHEYTRLLHVWQYVQEPVKVRHLTQDQINEKLELHQKYLRDGLNAFQADFTNCNLIGANFSGWNIESIDFRSSNLTNANFSGSDLQYVNFENADTKNANFEGAHFGITIKELGNQEIRVKSIILSNEKEN